MEEASWSIAPFVSLTIHAQCLLSALAGTFSPFATLAAYILSLLYGFVTALVQTVIRHT
jgi:hypothetical protein